MKTRARTSKLSFTVGADTPEVEVVMKSKKFRDLRAQLEALQEEPRGTPLRVDVQLPDNSTEEGMIEEEVKAVQNAVYGWARARRLQQQGLHVAATKKITSASTAVVRVEIINESDSTAADGEVEFNGAQSAA